MIRTILDALTSIEASKYLQKTFGLIVGFFLVAFIAMVWFLPYLVLMVTIFFLTHK